MSGMIFAAIHVVLTIANAEATDDLQVPLPIYLSALLVSVFGLVELVVSKVRNAYLVGCPVNFTFAFLNTVFTRL